MIMRCIAHGIPCSVVQFIKGGWETGEKMFPARTVRQGMPVFSCRARGLHGKRRTATATWQRPKTAGALPKNRSWTLKSASCCWTRSNIALRYDYLDIDEVVDFLQSRKPPMTHVCLTGRNAKPELLEAADLVTEMTLLKHPFKDGVKAQKGIEF